MRRHFKTVLVHEPRRRGLIYLEIFAASALLLLLAALFAATVLQYAGVRRETDARRELLLAANAELDRMRAGLLPLPAGTTEPPPATQPGETIITASATPGTGPWQGLTRVQVIATRLMKANRTLRVELVGYVDPGGRP